MRLALLALSCVAVLVSTIPTSRMAIAAAISSDDAELEVRLDQARAQIGTGEAAVALETVRSVLETHPNHGDALVALGVALHTLGQVQDGLHAYEAAERVLGKQVSSNQSINHTAPLYDLVLSLSALMW
jgi:Flp pilus assembly protein TadD